jgi:hypothetical protein
MRKKKIKIGKEGEVAMLNAQTQQKTNNTPALCLSISSHSDPATTELLPSILQQMQSSQENGSGCALSSSTTTNTTGSDSGNSGDGRGGTTMTMGDGRHRAQQQQQQHFSVGVQW